VGSVQIKHTRPWHEALLEFILANPRASGVEIALYFNVTEAWVSTVKNSDAFQELWAKRRGEHFSRVSSSIAEKVTALAEVTVDTLTDEIEKSKRKGELKIETLKETADMALKALGFGAKGVQSPLASTINIQQNNFSVDKETLARAREQKMKLAQTVSATSLPSIDAESRPEAPKLLEVTRKEENAQSN
jgi:hypothetical protein